MQMSTAINNSRRQFLRGRTQPVRQLLRPPWAVEQFSQLCSSCGDCYSLCPQHLLQPDDNNKPVIRFSMGECDFCGECANGCKTGALDITTNPQQQVWSFQLTISHNCLAVEGVVCRSCGENCPERAILFQPLAGHAPQPQFRADRCIGCGACIGSCPAAAISIYAADNGITVTTMQVNPQLCEDNV